MNPLLLVFTLALVVDEWKPDHPVQVAPDGITDLEAGYCRDSAVSFPCARTNRSVATARLRTRQLEEGAQDGGERNRGFHCSGGRIRCSPVLDIEFEIDGRNVYVPASVYADIADVNTAELRQTGKSLTLELECGDASGSYSVRVSFDADGVLKRQIVSGFGTNEVAEETSYFELTPLD
jgi:hypothetical protein